MAWFQYFRRENVITRYVFYLYIEISKLDFFSITCGLLPLEHSGVHHHYFEI